MGFQICVISEGYLDQNDEMAFMTVVMLVVVVVMLVKMVVFCFTKSAFVHCNLNISSPPIPAERIWSLCETFELATIICLTVWLGWLGRSGQWCSQQLVASWIKKNGNDSNYDNAMLIAVLMTIICFHSFGTFWTSSTGNWWEITEVGRLRCFIEFFAHFTFLTPFVHLKQVLL